mmetsp:Transcript_8606/g.35263  ORF Transcript_8606/g.35263 Transcript_8606/m.35263 type:complete len:246 (-) Transcript_8606:325-1062(-)
MTPSAASCRSLCLHEPHSRESRGDKDTLNNSRRNASVSSSSLSSRRPRVPSVRRYLRHLQVERPGRERRVQIPHPVRKLGQHQLHRSHRRRPQRSEIRGPLGHRLAPLHRAEARKGHIHGEPRALHGVERGVERDGAPPVVLVVQDELEPVAVAADLQSNAVVPREVQRRLEVPRPHTHEPSALTLNDAAEPGAGAAVLLRDGHDAPGALRAPAHDHVVERAPDGPKVRRVISRRRKVVDRDLVQ